MGSKVKNLTQEEFKDYTKKRREDDYVLVDVREPEEYEEEHIPGAVLIPLKEVQTRILEFDTTKDFIFYCLSGKRSMVAANLIADMDVISGDIYKLEGGILYWQGKPLMDYPKFKVIETTKGISFVLKRAIDLEKGAQNFYKRCADMFEEDELKKIALLFSNFELAHAKAIYSILKSIEPEIEPFDNLYETLSGSILEGGMDIKDALEKLQQMEGNMCLNLCELALEIEYMAYDLYKNIAVREKDVDLVKTMFRLSEQEKLHIDSVSAMFSKCVKSSS